MKHKTRWTLQKLKQRLTLIQGYIYQQRAPLPAFRYQPLSGPEATPPVATDVDDSDWPIIQPYDYWALPDVNFVLRTRFSVPGDWQGDVDLILPMGEEGIFSHPESLLYIDGQPFAASDRHHQHVRLSEAYHDGQEHLLALHGWSGIETHDHVRRQMFQPELGLVNHTLRRFVALARVALGTVENLDENDPVYTHLLNALDAAFLKLDTREPLGTAFYESVEAALPDLKSAIKGAGLPLDVTMSAVGHAHIDVAWLWSLAQTRHKAARTFYTVLHLMQQFPDYHFTQSTPQLYEYVREDHPTLFEGIRTRVAEGRWEPIGGMWVEADTNLTGAEALVRQFLLGRHYFKTHFGENAESPVLWLPDVFGYTWSLPQLIRDAGLDYFMTIKIGWNQYNRMPYDSFWWQGIDGTRVLTHFSTTPEIADTFRSQYNSTMTPFEVLGTWRHLQQKADQNHLLTIFGYGDGGGGPTPEMLENTMIMADFPGLPRVTNERAIDFFRRLEAESGASLPTWNGELYLEYHRGTYTTQAANKRANRESEFLLHDAEFLASLASLLDSGFAYPHEALTDLWKLVCLNQFHDIIPGSSISQVYTDSLAQYAEVSRQLQEEIIPTAIRSIQAQVDGTLLLMNPTSFAYSGLVYWRIQLAEGHNLITADGEVLITQQDADGGIWLAVNDIPPYSVQGFTISTAAEHPELPESLHVSAAPYRLENAYLLAEFNESGDLVRLYDKAQDREVLPEGSIGNQFQAFEDRPINFDAWDIEAYYDDRTWYSESAESIHVKEVGPLRATLVITRGIMNSTYTQEITLHYDSPQLTFYTDIDWRERHMLLKVAFPVDVLAMHATYDIQWGNVARPTHTNTSWDWARFETVAHKWVDVSEADYGISLLNDCKYGHDVHDGVLRLTLLRSPTWPDPEADKGVHRFTYSLLPHEGDWRSRTIPAAYWLNDPVRVISETGELTTTADQQTLCSVDDANVVIETVKRAEDNNGIVLRLYESHRKRTQTTLRFSRPLHAVWQTNLLEETQSQVQPDDDSYTLKLTFRPYEIMTLYCTF